jgi:DNA-binding transcriptional MocR family regulator
MQRALAAALEDPELDVVLGRARDAYAARRQAATDALSSRLPAGSVAPAADGVNLWVRLPDGCDLLDVIHDAAELGVLVSSGEPFFIRPGRANTVRLSISWVTPDEARRAGEILAAAALTVDMVPVPIGV